MNIRITFTIKIILPYMALAVIFLAIFLGELGRGHSQITWLASAGLLISVAMGLVHVYWLRKPLNRTRRLVKQLTRGIIPTFTAQGAGDEIGELEQDLERHVGNLRSITSFTRAMASGDYSHAFEKLGNEDELGEALLSLQGSLMDSLRESEVRRLEEEARSWNAQGLAKFSTLFREAEDDLGELSRELMRELVAYTGADVGALFITNHAGESKPVLELTGSYAFDREKHVQRSFEFGEGLVGRTALEKEVILVTDLPPDYIKIRSGLGEDAPASLLLVPVLLDDYVLGVIEMASLGEIPEHQAEFVRQLGDALATTLAKVKANLQSRELFEQTKKQAEALASQEKVFRQNLERLEKAQREAAVREEQLKKEIERMKKSSH